MLVKFTIFVFTLFGFSGCLSSTQPLLNIMQEKQLQEKNFYGIALNDKERIVALTNYLVSKELNSVKPNFPAKPEKPSLPEAQKLIKGKYEKTVAFEERVEVAKKERIKHINALEESYAKEVKIYNAEIKKLTDEYNNTLAIKQKNIEAIKFLALQKAYIAVYGKPHLKNLKYDADSETFYADVQSQRGAFNEKVTINVPLINAKDFEKSVEDLQLEVAFDYTNDKLLFKNISVEKSNDEKYVAMLSDVNYKPQQISVAVNNGALNLPAAKLLSTSLDIDPAKYSIGEINYSKDPEIAALQKRKWELETKAQMRKNSQKETEALRQQKLALEAQIALMEDTKGGYDDIPTLLQNASSTKIDSTKWLFVVGVENYEFTDPVAYSANSAKRFTQVAQKRLGISQEKTRMLLNDEATSAKINYYLDDMLRHLKKGDSVYFYYSGHGIPVPSKKNEPYILAQDMSPDYVANYENFKLQNIYKKLSDSKASKVVAFVDSCFSGGADNQSLLKGVAATRVKAKSVRFDEQKC